MNYTLKPSIKSQLSDAAILQCNLIYLSSFKSKKFTNFVYFHTGRKLKMLRACTQQLATPAAICAHT